MFKYIFISVFIFVGLAYGVKNNNPLNIEYHKTNDPWVGYLGNDGRFVKFKEIKYGLRAGSRILSNYQSRHGINTVRGVITRWSPPCENNTELYIDNVCKWTGFGENERISLHDTKTKIKILKAMCRMESGYKATDVELIEAIKLSR